MRHDESRSNPSRPARLAMLCGALLLAACSSDVDSEPKGGDAGDVDAPNDTTSGGDGLAVGSTSGQSGTTAGAGGDSTTSVASTGTTGPAGTGGASSTTSSVGPSSSSVGPSSSSTSSSGGGQCEPGSCQLQQIDADGTAYQIQCCAYADGSQECSCAKDGQELPACTTPSSACDFPMCCPF